MDMHNVRQLLKVKSIYDIPLRVTYYARVSSESDEQLNSLGNQTLASYTYTTDQNHHLSKLDYGNGDSVQYSYDNYGRLVQETFEDGETVSCKYDNTGALTAVTDSATYNADGLRTSRTDGYTTYEYIYHGSQLTQMTVGDDRLRFGYDANGMPLYVIWNQSKYFYVTNLQGDVVAIVSESGYAVVCYTYDAWGNILSITGMRADNLGILNPLRYRGYVYDHETELYYLQSRYYNPEWGRFLNADAFVSTGQGILGNNMLAYCLNNPVNAIDETGCSGVGWGKMLMQTHLLKDYSSGGGSAFPIAGVGVGAIALGGVMANKTVDFLVDIVQSLSSYFASFQVNYATVEDELQGIANSFGNFKCKEAVDSMIDYLKKEGIKAQVITISYMDGLGYIWSDIAQKTISENGIHVGILYNGVVFCNVHPYGLPEILWVNDFHGTGTKMVSRMPIC